MRAALSSSEDSGAGLLPRFLISGTSESGGGSRTTWRETTSAPFLLAAITSDQVTPVPLPAFTSQLRSPEFGGSSFLSRAALAFHGAMTAPGSAYRALVVRLSGCSTVPVTVYFRFGPRTVMSEPMCSPADFRNASVATISPVPFGKAPSTRSSMPRAIASEVRNSTMSTSATPYPVVTFAGTDWMLMARAPFGNVVRRSIAGKSSSGGGSSLRGL